MDSLSSRSQERTQWAPVNTPRSSIDNCSPIHKSWDTDCSTNTFWFPFAFKKSAFLRHYQRIFTSPDILVPLYRSSAGELRSLALERSLETIQCVESRLASSDVSRATSDSVIHAVLAMICYNVSFLSWQRFFSMRLNLRQFTSLDFDQAMIHVKGMRMVISARGGISSLEANQDLMLMVSWYVLTNVFVKLAVFYKY